MTAEILDLALIRRERACTSGPALATGPEAQSAGDGGLSGAGQFPNLIDDDVRAYARWLANVADDVILDNIHGSYDDETPNAA